MSVAPTNSQQPDPDCAISFSHDGDNGKLELKRIVQALARQQAKADHDATRSH